MVTRSVQELAQEMVDEIEQGIDGTELKADHRGDRLQRRKDYAAGREGIYCRCAGA